MVDDTDGRLAAFHAGERALQLRDGLEERAALARAGVIRPAMPDQHRAFFHSLPFVLLGVVDADGHPWATLREGWPGFIIAPDPTTLAIRAPSPFDAVVGRESMPGDRIGVLGIVPETRRRNRVNGTVLRADEQGVTLRVDQSFGNCPKYIQARVLGLIPVDAPAPNPTRRPDIDADAAGLIAAADTFFIATRAGELGGRPAAGVDISHRGGKPGFVKVDGGHRLLFPDFPGNRFFNTLGNLHQDPRAGLLFIDFATGTTVNVQGRADIVWDGPVVECFQGAQRVIALAVDQVITMVGHLGLRGGPAELSPTLRISGDWP